MGAIAVRIKRMARRAVKPALVTNIRGKPAEIRRECIIEPAMNGIYLAVAAVLIDNAAVLRARRLIIVRLHAHADGRRQTIEFLADSNITRLQIIRRRRDRIDRRTECTDALVQMSDLETAQHL